MTTPNFHDNRYHQITRKCAIILSLLLLLVVPIAASASARAVTPAASAEATGASISLDGPTEAQPSATISYDIMTDATELYGAQLEISFDPDVLQVIGTKITPGVCPNPDFVAVNSVNNSAGVISYAASALNPTVPCDGGIVASFQFQVLPTAAKGITAVQFTDAILADKNGDEIPSTPVNLDLEITGATAEFSGTPLAGPAPLTVDFTNLSSGDYSACTWDFGDSSGSSTCADQSHLYANPGTYTVSLTVTGLGGTAVETKVDYIVAWEYWVNLPVVLR